MWTGSRTTGTLFQCSRKPAIDVLLGVTVIDDHILAIFPEERKATVCESNPAAMVEERSMPVYALLNTKATKS